MSNNYDLEDNMTPQIQQGKGCKLWNLATYSTYHWEVYIYSSGGGGFLRREFDTGREVSG